MRALVIALFAAGCGVNNPTYFAPPGGPVETGAMGAGEVSATVTLPFRVPTDDERAKLDEASTALGFRVPWLRRDKVAISVQYAVTNLTDMKGTAQILVDGANEITSYDRAAIQMAVRMMAAAINNEEVEVLSLITGKPFSVPAGGTVTGTVREDDFVEAELDLDAIGRWMAPPAAVLINASEVNGVGLETMPPAVVVPAMFRVVVTLAASRAMRLDFLVRVRDTESQLIDPKIGGDPFAPMPAGYMPPAMMP